MRLFWRIRILRYGDATHHRKARDRHLYGATYRGDRAGVILRVSTPRRLTSFARAAASSVGSAFAVLCVLFALPNDRGLRTGADFFSGLWPFGGARPGVGAGDAAGDRYRAVSPGGRLFSRGDLLLRRPRPRQPFWGRDGGGVSNFHQPSVEYGAGRVRVGAHAADRFAR